MKRIVLLLAVLMTLTDMSYASFPIENELTNSGFQITDSNLEKPWGLFLY